MLKQIKSFVSFWYLRYLLATELYILEPWEKNLIHVCLGVLFVGFWYMNYSLVASEVPALKNAPLNDYIQSGFSPVS